MTLKTLRDNLLWIAFFLCVATYAQARNDYLNDYGTCERGQLGNILQKLDNTNIKQAQVMKHQNQTLGFRFRMPLGAVCR